MALAWHLRRDEGLVLIKPEETGKVMKRDKFNNPPRVVPCESLSVLGAAMSGIWSFCLVVGKGRGSWHHRFSKGTPNSFQSKDPSKIIKGFLQQDILSRTSDIDHLELIGSGPWVCRNSPRSYNQGVQDQRLGPAWDSVQHRGQQSGLERSIAP